MALRFCKEGDGFDKSLLISESGDAKELFGSRIDLLPILMPMVEIGVSDPRTGSGRCDLLHFDGPVAVNRLSRIEECKSVFLNNDTIVFDAFKAGVVISNPLLSRIRVIRVGDN